MSDCNFEQKSQTLNVELMAGQTNQAAALLRNELYCNPSEAMALIDRAQQLRGTPEKSSFVVTAMSWCETILTVSIR